MPRTSKKHFNKGFREKIWKTFWKELEKSKKSGSADFLLKFLTEEERTTLEKRLATIYFLKQGKSLRETSRKSGVSKQTVISIKRGLRKPNYKKRTYSKSPKKSKFKRYPKSYSRGRWDFLKTE